MSTAVRAGDRRRVDDRTLLLLGGVDVALIVGLIVAGQRSHGISPVSDPIASASTVVPFLIGWLVAALLAGVYARGVAASPARAARVTTVAWLAAANLGLILRSSPLFEGSAVWPFNLVMSGTGFVVLVGWRVGYAAVGGAER